MCERGDPLLTGCVLKCYLPRATAVHKKVESRLGGDVRFLSVLSSTPSISRKYGKCRLNIVLWIYGLLIIGTVAGSGLREYQQVISLFNR